MVGVVAVTDDEYRDAIEQAHLIRELRDTPGWAIWENICARRIEAKKREMIQGVPATVEAYRHTAGWIEGAEYALGAVGQLEQRIDRERHARKDAKAAA